VAGIAKLHGRNRPEDVANVLLKEQRLHAKIDDLRELICQHYDTLMRIDDAIVAWSASYPPHLTTTWKQ